jgi:hypothetical protein
VRYGIAIAILSGVAAAQEIPTINVGGIVPNRPGAAGPITPGVEVSIYGRHLGPETACTAGNGGWSDVKELCGTSVTVAGIPAGLLYVQEQQINLRIPFDAPTEGDAPFVVTREGRASIAMAVRFASYRASIKLSGMAYVDMPIWVEVQLPDPLGRSLRYPVTMDPTDFGGHAFEVRRNGVLLRPNSPRKSSQSMGGIGSFGTVGHGSLVGLPHEPANPRRLPLHLAYRFDKPGFYEVRYLGYDYRYMFEKHVLVRSPWIPIQVRSFSAARRQAWLDTMRRAEPRDPVEWLSDYLPSLLAVPDAATLSFFKGALYHPDGLVRTYARNALSLFDDGLLADWLTATIQANGSTPELAYLLSWDRLLFQARGADIVRALLPYVKSTSPLLAAGALQTLYFMKPQYDWKSQPDLPALMDRTVAGEAGRLIATHDATILQPLALYLGVWKSEASRTLLRRLVAEGTVREQAQICLRWIGEEPAH